MGISLKQKAVFFRQLATLSEASVPLLKSIEILKKQLRGAQFKVIAQDLETSIAKGVSISSVISKYKTVFTPFEIQLIKSGEESGKLPARLTNITNHLENLYNLRLKIMASLIYPFILINAGILIPPVIQAAAKGVAFYFKAVLINICVLYGGAFVIYLIYKLLKSSPQTDAFLGRLSLLTPVAGKMNYRLSLSGYLSNFAELNEAGINLTTANELAKDTVSNIIIRKKLYKISEYLKEGMPVTAAFSRTKLFDATSLGIITAGEEAGSISASLKKAAEYLQKDAENDLKKIMVILPALIFLIIAIYFGYIIITFYTGYFNNIFKVLEP